MPPRCSGQFPGFVNRRNTMISKLNRWVSQVLDWSIGIIMGTIVIFLFIGVILRYLFNAPLFWSEEVAVLGLVWLTFLGGAILVRQDKNVSITLVTDACPARIRRWIKALADVLVILILAVMIYQSWKLTGRRALATTPALRIQESWFGWAMVSGFSIMLYYQVQHLVAVLLDKQPFPETKERDTEDAV